MNPQSWREMVDRSRELELALGDGIKRVEGNEQEASIVRRRCLRARTDLPAGHVLCASDLKALRPRPKGSVEPFEEDKVVGRTLGKALAKGDALSWDMFS